MKCFEKEIDFDLVIKYKKTKIKVLCEKNMYHCFEK